MQLATKEKCEAEESIWDEANAGCSAVLQDSWQLNEYMLAGSFEGIFPPPSV